MQTVSYDQVSFVKLDWQDIADLTRKLADQIIQSGESFDRIVALANGGLTMVRHLGDLLNLHTISTMQTKYYVGVNETQYQPLLVQPLPVDIHGERLLIFEDVVDSGATLAFVQDYLHREGAQSVAVATQIVKPHAQVKPRWEGATLTGWVIFPYETRETVRVLTEKWQKEGVAGSIIQSRLIELDLVDKS